MKQLPLRRAARWTPSLQALPALSLRQPYARLVVQGIKDIENRSWRTLKRGPILIHASMSLESLDAETAAHIEAQAGGRIPREYDIGGIVGVAEIVDCVRTH